MDFALDFSTYPLLDILSVNARRVLTLEQIQ